MGRRTETAEIFLRRKFQSADPSMGVSSSPAAPKSLELSSRKSLELSSKVQPSFDSQQRHSLFLREEHLLEVSGVGLHTGHIFNVKIKRSPGGTGQVFRVKHPLGDCTAPALWTRLSGTTRSTALVLRGPRVKVELRTIEHLMAALFVLGLKDVEIELSLSKSSGDHFPEVFEIPVLDGSSAEWIQHLLPFQEEIMRNSDKNAGFKTGSGSGEESFNVHESFYDAWLLTKEFILEDGDRSVRLIPFKTPRAQTEFSVNVDFGPSLKQNAEFCLDWKNLSQAQQEFSASFAGARTFGFQHEVDSLRARGLALGAQLQNAVLIDGDQVVNEGGFRMPNELAAHKLVDAVGDFALLGAPLLGRIELNKAGHSMHVKALKEAVDQGLLTKVSFLRL